MEQLSSYTGNVTQLFFCDCYNSMDWLTVDILKRWNLKEVEFFSSSATTSLVSLIAQTCSELTNIKLKSVNIVDAAVIVIAQHCSKLETLQLATGNITWTSLLALSERGLPLKELYIHCVPHIPTADIARRCSHALSSIRALQSYFLLHSGQDLNLLIPNITGLTSLNLFYPCPSYVPLLAQHCHKLTKIEVSGGDCPVADILSLCHASPQLESIWFYCKGQCDISDTTLIELIHACLHLHTLYIPFKNAITDTGIITLSEHCPQLQRLTVNRCHNVTEAAVLQLLQRCHKLTRLEVSSSSLSEETWTQLDRNTQKRVSRHADRV